MEPLWLLRYLPNMPACHIGIFADARGPNNSLTLEDASGNLAIGEAAAIIGRGWADVMIAGTTGTRVHPVKPIHALLWDELASGDGPPEGMVPPVRPEPQRPGVRRRRLLLDPRRRRACRSRGATILGTVLGSGASCVDRTAAARTSPRPSCNAMRAALRADVRRCRHRAHQRPRTRLEDHGHRERLAAIQEVLQRAPDLPVDRLKSYFGNAGSGLRPLRSPAPITACGTASSPHAQYETPDPDCQLKSSTASRAPPTRSC